MEKLINRKLINYARDIVFFSLTGFAGHNPYAPIVNGQLGSGFLVISGLGFLLSRGLDLSMLPRQDVTYFNF